MQKIVIFIVLSFIFFNLPASEKIRLTPDQIIKKYQDMAAEEQKSYSANIGWNKKDWEELYQARNSYNKYFSWSPLSWLMYLLGQIDEQIIQRLATKERAFFHTINTEEWKKRENSYLLSLTYCPRQGEKMYKYFSDETEKWLQDLEKSKGGKRKTYENILSNFPENNLGPAQINSIINTNVDEDLADEKNKVWLKQDSKLNCYIEWTFDQEKLLLEIHLPQVNEGGTRKHNPFEIFNNDIREEYERIKNDNRKEQYKIIARSSLILKNNTRQLFCEFSELIEKE